MKKKLVTMLTLSIMTMSLLSGCGESKEKKEVNTIVSEDVISEDIVSEDVVSENAVVSKNVTVSENVVSEDIVSENAVSENTTTEVVQAPTYTYTDASAVKYAKSSVNVRDIPDKIGNKLGALSLNDEVTVTGTCNETGWYRITYNNNVGYVHGSYLVDAKIEPPAPVAQATTTTQTATSAQSSENPYPLYQLIDEGGQEVYFYALTDGKLRFDDASNALWDEGSNLIASRFPPAEPGVPAHYQSYGPYGDTGYRVDGRQVWRFNPFVYYNWSQQLALDESTNGRK